MAKKRKKWYQNKLLITICSLIVSTLLGFLVTYGFTIRNENINRSRIETNISYAESLIDQNAPQDALKKIQELLTTVSKEIEPKLYARIKLDEGRTFFIIAYSIEQELNLKKAISAYEEALKIFTIDKYPGDYAIVQNAISGAYKQLSEINNKEENLAKAQKAKEEAEKVSN